MVIAPGAALNVEGALVEVAGGRIVAEIVRGKAEIVEARRDLGVVLAQGAALDIEGEAIVCNVDRSGFTNSSPADEFRPVRRSMR